MILVDREIISKLVDAAHCKGYRWALEKYLRQQISDELYSYALNENRGDWSVFLPIDKGNKILYLEPVFGSVTISLARRAGTVITTGTIRESLEFIKIRGRQEEIENIGFVHIEPTQVSLPFRSEVFDIIALNGVHMEIGRSTPTNEYDINQSLLREAYRIVKDYGFIYIGGENKIGFGNNHIYSLLRKLIRSSTNKQYSDVGISSNCKMFSYTYWGYKKLLMACGFHNIKVFIPFNSYLFPSYIVSFDDEKILRYLVERKIRDSQEEGSLKQIFLTLIRIVLSSGILRIGRYFVNDYIILAQARKR